jgi:hypothetical protein
MKKRGYPEGNKEVTRMYQRGKQMVPKGDQKTPNGYE